MTLTDEEVFYYLDRAHTESPHITEEAQEIVKYLLEQLKTRDNKTLNAIWIAVSVVERRMWIHLKNAVIDVVEKYGSLPVEETIFGEQE